PDKVPSRKTIIQLGRVSWNKDKINKSTPCTRRKMRNCFKDWLFIFSMTASPTKVPTAKPANTAKWTMDSSHCSEKALTLITITFPVCALTKTPSKTKYV